jgi:hypothetical protein
VKTTSVISSFRVKALNKWLRVLEPGRKCNQTTKIKIDRPDVVQWMMNKRLNSAER